MASPELTAHDVKGLAVIVPTPVKDGCGRWDAKDVVDFDETERVVKAFLAAGIDMIWTNGTFGEGASLLWEEIRQFAEVVIATVKKKIPVFVGATTLNTRETIRRGSALQQIGVDGLFLGRPMWCALDDISIVHFYRDIAEALPRMPIVVYDNPEAFKGKISTEVYAELSKIPQIIAAKYRIVGKGPNPPDYYVSDLKAVNGRIKLMPPDIQWLSAAKWFPKEADACWSSGACCGPNPIVRMRDAVRSGRMDEAESIAADLRWAFETFLPGGSYELFNRYNIQVEKVRFNAAGFVKAGPALPPYHFLPEEYRRGAEEAGRRLKQLQDKYSAPGTESAKAISRT